MTTIQKISNTSKLVKKTLSFVVLIALVFAFVLLAGCKGDDPSASEIMTNQLTVNTWKVSSVTVDGTDQTSLFTNMTLTFTSASYTTANGGVVWPSSGTWTFTDKTATSIVRNDDLEIDITEVTANSLKLSLTWARNTFEPGRISSVAGNHVFSFVKN
jgi:hypothetical protein